MTVRRMFRVAALGALCLLATALAGLPWADASPRHAASAAPRALKKCVALAPEDEPLCAILPVGPRGPAGPKGSRGLRGVRGAQGVAGPQGAVGPAGATGPQGPAGPQGVPGPQGVVGPQGPQGVQGAPGHTIMVAGSRIGPVTATNVNLEGTPLTSVAVCPVGPDPEAYGGGVVITKTGPNSGGDVVPQESSFPGAFAGGNTVNPIPSTTPGAQSTSPANAYSATAVIAVLNNGDSVTVQAYADCGP